jgi:heat-inducible transcriptional repressor
MSMLRNVVDLYVETGIPVSSRRLREAFGLDISTANIRNMLHRLEEKGFLYKRHVSAGRIPSDIGYRVYVNDIKPHGRLDRNVVEEIKRKIGQDCSEVRDIMSRTSRLLADLTSYMGLILGIFYSHGLVDRLRIVQLEGNLGLVIVYLRQGRERHVSIEFPKRYPLYIIDRAVQMINERIAGYPLESAPEHIEAFLKDSAGLEREIAQAVVEEAEHLFNWAYDINYYFKGLDRSFDLPELNSTRVLQNLIRIMGERNLMLKVMRNRMKHDSLVTIGSENELEELEDFSIITHKFNAGECEGLLGILGPTRMTYGLVLSILQKMAEELHRTV